MGRRSRAFTLLELLIVLMIAGVSMTGLMLSLKAPKQTAEREARRVLRFLQNATEIAERIRREFSVPWNVSKGIRISWKPDPVNGPELTLKPSRGCSFKLNWNLEYSLRTQKFFGGTITITGADNSKHYVKISGQGRIQMTPVN